MERLRSLSLVCLLFGSAVAAEAQSDVDIQPDPIECWPIDEFLMVHSLFVPPENIQTARFYFRSTAFPDYYFVDLTMVGGDGSAIVPKAHPDTVEVTFYVELLTFSFDAFRTEEKTVPVESANECKRRNPAALFFSGENPNIAVSATRPGATPLPPGFQADGITSFLNATSSSESAGGVSGKTIGIIAGVAGGAAAGIAVSQGGDSDTTTSVASSTTTAIAATTSASTTTAPAPTTSVSTSTAATTSNPTTSVQGNADLTLTKTGSASGAVGQNLNYSITVRNLGPSNAAGVRVIDTWTAGLADFVGSSPVGCTPQTANRVRCDIGSMPAGGNPITIRITLVARLRGTLTNSASVALNSPNDPVSSNNSQSVQTRIALTDGPPADMDLTYRSSIDVAPRNGSVRGQIVVNGGSFQATDNAGEYGYTARVQAGQNRVETRLDLPVGSSGTWRFDFGASAEFVSGSLRVESGQVLSQDGASIVFTLGRGAPPPRFTFEVGEGRRSPPR